jgi:hypothetical protein
MSFYKCPRCGYLAKQRTDLRRHFLRKKACPNKYEDITIEECFKTILFEEKPSDNQMTTLRKNSDNQMTTFLSVNDMNVYIAIRNFDIEIVKTFI